MTENRGLGLSCAECDYSPKPTKYLVAPYLPLGKCVLLDADGGVGKTSLALNWAAALSQGHHPVFKEDIPGGPVKTLYLHKGEDTDEELLSVYYANEGQKGHLMMLKQEHASLLKFDAKGIKRLKETIEDTGVKFVVVDALMYFLEGQVGDGNKAMEVMKALQRMNDLARETGVSFLNIRHLRKTQPGSTASDMGIGSVQFRNSHRGQLLARWHPKVRGMVIVTDEKGSLTNPRGPHFCYSRSGNGIAYDNNQENPFETQAATARKAPKHEECEAFIYATLTYDWTRVTDLHEKARAQGISVYGTLKDVRAEMTSKGILESDREAGRGPYVIRFKEGYDPFAE